MPDFLNSKVYKISNSVDNEIYIGSTALNLQLRLYFHKQCAKKFPMRRVYNHFNNIGWDKISIECLESFECNSKLELRKKEQFYMDMLNPSLNSAKAYQNCPHSGNKSLCKICVGTSICSHGKRKTRCIQCKGSSICSHNKRKSRCVECSPYDCGICNKILPKDNYDSHCKTKKHIKNHDELFLKVFGEKY